jgi:antitoxin component of MazEF toxin-antitoxin module
VKLAIRHVGNSLGVIIPRRALQAWGVGPGDALELTAGCIRPPRATTGSHDVLDELKRGLAAAVAARFTARDRKSVV